MPHFSDTMEEGMVVKWHKNVGDKVEEGDVIAEIETDKAIQEFESEFVGVLLYQGLKEGETAKVDTVLAEIGEECESFDVEVDNTSEEVSTEKEDVTIDETSTVESISQEIPDNVNVVYMPQLSDTMEEGTVTTWHKKVGEKVEEGDVIAEIETDKAVQEFESEFDGTLLYIGAEEGQAAPVNTILAIIGPKIGR